VQREINMDRDDLWIVEHFSELVNKYAGKFVAVVNEKLVAVGDSRRDVETKAREVEPEKIPSVLRVPREEDMVCLLSSSHTRFTKAT
jgi:GH35 family endo-1,4-beta-xylanase